MIPNIQAQFHIEKNSDARVQQLVSAKVQAKVEPTVETEVVLIDENNSSKKVKSETGLETVFKKELTELLREYANVFAWSPNDITGLDESLTMHILDVDQEERPVKQMRNFFAPEWQEAIDEEVEKLLKADIICEITYLKWLANMVMVKKSKDKWRMCVDYTNLNAACPKVHILCPTSTS